VSEEGGTNPKALSAKNLRIVILASLTSTVLISVVLALFVPLEPWLVNVILAAIWISEFIALGVIVSLHKRAARPNFGGLVWSGFGEQRPDIGSKPPSRRH